MKKLYLVISVALIISCMPSPLAAYSYLLETLGEAIPREDGLLLVSGIGLSEEAWDEVLLYVDEAEIYDLRTGFSMNAQDIYEGDIVRVVYESEGDLNSGSPFAQALIVYAHAGEPDSADLMVVVSDNIWHSGEGCSFVTIDGKYRITLTDESLLLDEYGFEMSFEEITPGMEMFVWASFVTASFPGQLIPEKIVLLGYRD